MFQILRSNLRSGAATAALLLALLACSDEPYSPEPAPTRDPGSLVTAQTVRGWVRGPGGSPMEATFTVVDGHAMLEGDMDFGPVGQIARSRSELVGSAELPDSIQGASVADHSFIGFWPNGVVAYEISSSFAPSQVSSILAGMQMVSGTAAGVSFTPRTWQSYYVRIEPSDNTCSSTVGVQSFPFHPQHKIKLSPGCAASPGTVAHELLHTLGFWHEQGRCDRNAFVTVQYANIWPGKHDQFERRCPSSGYAWDVGGIDVLDYDESSIMHYPAFDWSGQFSIDPSQPILVSARGLAGAMGQRFGLSYTDVHSLNHVYQPYQIQGFAVSYPGSVPTLSWAPYGKGALSYSVNLVVVYEEYDDYNGTSMISDHTTDGVGTTTGSSLVDGTNTFTGTHRCVLWSSINGSASYNYYYEAIAHFPFGKTSTPLRWPANVAPASC